MQLFEEMLGPFDEAILNEIDCPLLILTKTFLLVPPTALICETSVCHQCSDSCVFKELPNGKLSFSFSFWHDWNNDIYVSNIYCMCHD